MSISFFTAVNFGVLFILLVLLVRFAWNMWFSAAFHPHEWISARKNGMVGKKLVALSRSYPDKVRFFTWWLQVERLKREHVPGSFAEVGVYKGDSARVLHHMDQDRIFHLFDTFGGFEERDLAEEKGEAAAYTTRHFANTHPKKVAEKISGNDNLVIHQGYFPDTADAVAGEMFALVNIDADLGRPTRAALDFFFPRLSPGGVIFVHDYNRKWEGILNAVDDFAKSSGEVPVLLPDADSTAIFIKRKK